MVQSAFSSTFSHLTQESLKRAIIWGHIFPFAYLEIGLRVPAGLKANKEEHC